MSKTLMDAKKISQMAENMRSATPAEILVMAVRAIPKLSLACSFGAEDMVLLDVLMKVNPNATVFYLDTDVLFPETYELRDKAVQKYGLPGLVRISPNLTLEAQAEQHGDALWARNPNKCCDLRKVQPLKAFLAMQDGWITGIRREQSLTRAHAEVFEWDAQFGLIKVNPLAYWSDEQVWQYLRDHDVPFNPLHLQGYPSIGCIHCTRPVAPGEDARSGRWAGFQKTECGLHARPEQKGGTV